MQCFRRLRPFRAISFDLDDTLYDNRPVMARAEAWMVSHMRDSYLETAMYDAAWWQRLKLQLQQDDPVLRDDVTLCRLRLLQTGLEQGGMPASRAATEAEAVFERFLDMRCAIDVPARTREVLQALSARYPLVVISNGNVQIDRLGLDHHFVHILHAGNGLRMKPAPDLFTEMARRLQLPPGEILHVGDNAHTDVSGAVRNGLQSAWLNDVGQDWRSLRTLPDIMLDRLDELLSLV